VARFFCDPDIIHLNLALSVGWSIGWSVGWSVCLLVFQNKVFLKAIRLGHNFVAAMIANIKYDLSTGNSSNTFLSPGSQEDFMALRNMVIMKLKLLF